MLSPKGAGFVLNHFLDVIDYVSQITYIPIPI